MFCENCDSQMVAVDKGYNPYGVRITYWVCNNCSNEEISYE